MKLILFISLLLCIIISNNPSFGYLKIHPSNPHYFLETRNNKPVILLGYGSIVPTASDVNYNLNIKELASNNIDYSRVWHFLPWSGDNAIWPWQTVYDSSKKKVDMNKWNPNYWMRLRHSISQANRFGIYAEIHLFDRCGMSPPDISRWGNNPWASDNNINDLETPSSDKDGTPDFYKINDKPNLRSRQEQYISKMIDETIKFPNLIYEIENEHWEDNDPYFGIYYSGFVKKYIADNYPDHPRLVAYNSLMNDLDYFFSVNDVDIINKHFGNEAEINSDLLNSYLENNWKKNKAINIDEFANGLSDPDILRKMCWTIIVSGGNFHIEDASPKSNPYNVIMNIKNFLKSSKWDFIHTSPDKTLVHSGDGYCMKQPDIEYLFYFPAGGRKVIDLPIDRLFESRWWNVKSGGFTSAKYKSDNDNRFVFETPDRNDWVLFVSIMKKDN